MNLPTFLKKIDSLLKDKSITELMWNSHNSAFVEKEGHLVEINSPFVDAFEYERWISEFAQIYGGPADVFDCILPDGSRAHVTRPPCSPYASTLTIRKFSNHHRGLEALIKAGFLSEKAAVFLKACVRSKKNIVISGATGAGKTTLMNALLSESAHEERIITVEDVAEIQINRKNWVRLLSDVKNGRTARECLVGCLRMRPDRIVVGECRSSETLEMLQMMNTGHDGSMTTVHSNSSYDSISRLETLILFNAGADIPLRALRRQIVDAIDLIVHVSRNENGKRNVEEIIELVGMEGEIITRTALFKRVPTIFSQTVLKATGLTPTFLTEIMKGPIALPQNFFDQETFEAG